MATDRFELKLTCPSCGLTGIAKAQEEDGWAFVKGKTDRRITHTPAGFKAVADKQKKSGVDILCTQCELSAIF